MEPVDVWPSDAVSQLYCSLYQISYETEHLKPRICILVYYRCEQSQLLSISKYSKNRYYSPSSEQMCLFKWKYISVYLYDKISELDFS